jgi:hypothetical protein
MHLTGKPAGLSPSDLPELLNQRPTSLLAVPMPLSRE